MDESEEEFEPINHSNAAKDEMHLIDSAAHNSNGDTCVVESPKNARSPPNIKGLDSIIGNIRSTKPVEKRIKIVTPSEGSHIIKMDDNPTPETIADERRKSMSVKERFELSMKEKIVQDEEKKKTQMPLKQQADPISVSLLSQKQEAELTLAERRELAIQEAKKAKEDRLAQYLGPSPDQAAKRPLTERFEQAKLDQQRAEEERLMRIRMSKENFTERRTSIKDVWAEAVHTSLTIEKERVEMTKEITKSQFRTTDGTGYVKRRLNEWEELQMQIAASVDQIKAGAQAARLKAQQYAEDREERMRLRRESRRLTVGADDEDLRDGSSESKAEIFVMGSTHIYQGKDLSPEGTNLLQRLLKRNKYQPLGLPCGVYGNQGNQPPVDVVAVALWSEVTDSSELGEGSSLLLAISIISSEGHDHDPDAYGIKKVAVLPPHQKIPFFERIYDIVPEEGWDSWLSAVQSQDKESTGKDIVGEENSIDGADMMNLDTCLSPRVEKTEVGDLTVAQGANECDCELLSEQIGFDSSGHETTEELQYLDDSFSRQSLASMHEEDVGIAVQHSQLDEMKKVGSDDQKFDGEQPFCDCVRKGGHNLSAGGAYVVPSSSATSMVVDTSKSEESNFVIEPENLMDDDVDVDDETETTLSPFNFGRKSSVAGVCEPREFNALDPRRASFSTRVQSIKNSAWSIEDEREDDIPRVQQIKLELSLKAVESVSSASNCLILQRADAATVITGTLKTAETPSRNLVGTDKMFEWTRGAAMSGWLYKWPMKSQGAGRRTRRFFILRDDLLSYHREKPTTQSVADADIALCSLRINDKTVVTKSRYYFWPCITITTSDDVLWVRCAGKQEEQDRWLLALKQSVVQCSKSKLLDLIFVASHPHRHSLAVVLDAIAAGTMLRHDPHHSTTRYVNWLLLLMQPIVRWQLFNRKSRIETVWHHESPTFELVAVDALSYSARRFFTAALFCLDGKTYSIDIGSSADSRNQLELRSPFDSTDLGSCLKCTKVCCSAVILGGSNGFVGVCSVDAEMCHDEETIRVLSPVYSGSLVSFQSYIGKRESANFTGQGDAQITGRMRGSGRRGHDPNATILCICSINDGAYFVTGDDMGVLCLWKLTLALPQKDKSSSEDFIPTFEEAVPSGMMLNDTVDLSELGDTKDKRKEYIRTLKFLPGDEQLAVGTNERLMILNVPKVINSLNISTTIDNIAKSLGEHDGNMSGSRKMDFDARREGFKIASEEVVTITPRVGFVIKSRRGNGQKVFINLTHHESLPQCFPPSAVPHYFPPRAFESEMEKRASDDPSNCSQSTSPFLPVTPLSQVLSVASVVNNETNQPHTIVLHPYIAVGDMTESEDSVGSPSSVYTVAASTALFSKLDKMAVKELSSLVIQQVNLVHGDSLTVTEFSLPKLKLGFKGEREHLDPMAVSLVLLPGTLCAAAVSIKPRRFESWVEIERVIAGANAVFSINVTEQHSPVFFGSDQTTMRRKIAVWKAVEDDEETGRQHKSKVCTTSLHRYEWNEEMFSLATGKMRPIRPGALDNAEI